VFLNQSTLSDWVSILGGTYSQPQPHKLSQVNKLEDVIIVQYLSWATFCCIIHLFLKLCTVYINLQFSSEDHNVKWQAHPGKQFLCMSFSKYLIYLSSRTQVWIIRDHFKYISLYRKECDATYHSCPMSSVLQKDGMWFATWWLVIMATWQLQLLVLVSQSEPERQQSVDRHTSVRLDGTHLLEAVLRLVCICLLTAPTPPAVKNRAQGLLSRWKIS
jgi:hypothetical protein